MLYNHETIVNHFLGNVNISLTNPRKYGALVHLIVLFGIIMTSPSLLTVRSGCFHTTIDFLMEFVYDCSVKYMRKYERNSS